MYVEYNPNPDNRRVGDCTVRAIAKATGQSWDAAYIGLAMQGLMQRDMPSSNDVWGEYLRSRGFKRLALPDTCPACYTVADFCRDHPQGIYVLGTGTHVVTAEDGRYYDSWDSGDEVPIYVWRKENV